MCLGIVGCQQILKHLTQKLRIERDLLVEGRIFLDGEVIAFQDVYDTTGRNTLLSLVTIKFGEVNILSCLFSKEEVVWEYEFTADLLAVRESIVVYAFILVVKAVEETAIEERNGTICQVNKELWIQEVALVAHQLVVVVVATAIAETTLRRLSAALLRNRAIEHGKEQVLQDGLIIDAFMRLKAEETVLLVRTEVLYKVVGNILLVEELVRYQMALFQEPNENKARDKADGTLVVILVVVLLVLNIVGETDNLNGPGIPVAQLAIEILRQRLNRESGTEVVIVNDTPLLVQILIGRIVGNAFTEQKTVAVRIAVGAHDVRLVLETETNLNE